MFIREPKRQLCNILLRHKKTCHWPWRGMTEISVPTSQRGHFQMFVVALHFLKSGALVIDGYILYIMMQGLTVIYGRKTTQCCFNFYREIFLCTTCSIRTTLCKLATYHSSPRPQREARPNELSAITIRRCNIWNYFPAKPANIKTHTVVCVALPLRGLHSHHRLAFIMSKKVDFLKLGNAKRRGKMRLN